MAIKSLTSRMRLVQCPLCGETVHVITSVHLEKMHGITINDFIKLNKNYIELTGLVHYKAETSSKRRQQKIENSRKWYAKNKERFNAEKRKKRSKKEKGE